MGDLGRSERHPTPREHLQIRLAREKPLAARLSPARCKAVAHARALNLRAVAGQSADSLIHDQAVRLIRDAYEIAAKMRNVDLESVNRPRPANLRYRSHAELVRDFTDSAGAMLNFAGELGLITQDEAIAILRDIGLAHPEIEEWLMKS